MYGDIHGGSDYRLQPRSSVFSRTYSAGHLKIKIPVGWVRMSDDTCDNDELSCECLTTLKL